MNKLSFLNALMSDFFKNLKHFVSDVYCLLNEFKDVVYLLNVFRIINCL